MNMSPTKDHGTKALEPQAFELGLQEGHPDSCPETQELTQMQSQWIQWMPIVNHTSKIEIYRYTVYSKIK